MQIYEIKLKNLNNYQLKQKILIINKNKIKKESFLVQKRKLLNYQQIEQLMLNSTTIVIAKIKFYKQKQIFNQKFDSFIQNLSIQLSQKKRDIADLQLNLADKEVQISQLQLKNNIQQLQNEQMKQQLKKVLSIIENFQLFSNNFVKLRQ
ncbi:hypothetical protein TTHERM_001273284 (macronuclear) [Tetrahymena thermophila SB210]|uniref:Uncharacterized protein n=1 Tax=Tetrahymena thermophila (strain SB210) TaxID=312017 RepID=W7XL34_TETTS|nr:hypothetical protein TTHERM_001273284 [Tetrahymena thermophila SB210]EWS75594.1 hypothetical protein TTHERM_001273284 [Tetrahymena thermophila SB210]|eukprot:XP_012651894.1 hypothetical protein TTHERM_001273284 [Tetrahymena thermophila SB210]